MDITFTIDNTKIQRIVDAMKGLYPIPEEDGEPLFTDSQWAKEAVRLWIIKQVSRYETKLLKDAANAPAEDDLVS